MKILGLGNALVDVLLRLEDDVVLSKIGVCKGAMEMIDQERMIAIRTAWQGLERTMAPGGSVCNTMRAISMLGGESGYLGKIGDDEVGAYYEEALRKAGVAPYFVKTSGISGSCTVLISPDGERTMCTFLGPAPTILPEEIQETTLLPTILPAEYSDDKLGVLDVAVLLKDGTQIDMEMQVVYFPYWTNRVLFYLCRMYAGQLKKGDSYNKLKKCIHVSLLDFVHFPEDKKCYHKISLCDTKTGKLYTLYDQVTKGTKNGEPIKATLKVEYNGKWKDGFAASYAGVYFVREIISLEK